MVDTSTLIMLNMFPPDPILVIAIITVFSLLFLSIPLIYIWDKYILPKLFKDIK